MSTIQELQNRIRQKKQQQQQQQVEQAKPKEQVPQTPIQQVLQTQGLVTPHKYNLRSRKESNMSVNKLPIPQEPKIDDISFFLAKINKKKQVTSEPQQQKQNILELQQQKPAIIEQPLQQVVIQTQALIQVNSIPNQQKNSDDFDMNQQNPSQQNIISQPHQIPQTPMNSQNSNALIPMQLQDSPNQISSPQNILLKQQNISQIQQQKRIQLEQIKQSHLQSRIQQLSQSGWPIPKIGNFGMKQFLTPSLQSLIYQLSQLVKDYKTKERTKQRPLNEIIKNLNDILQQ